MNHRKARGGIIEGLEKLESIYCYILESIFLTEVAGEGGTNCPLQKFLPSQKFRHLMG